jgi:hypothetical protein
MTPEEKRQIHSYADAAAKEGIATLSSCPYPPHTPGWFEFQAAYRLAGLPTSEQRIALERYVLASEALGRGA